VGDPVHLTFPSRADGTKCNITFISPLRLTVLKSFETASQTVTGQTAINYAYDNADRLTRITRGTPTVSFGYDNANRRTSLTLPNGISMSYSYDNASQLTSIKSNCGKFATKSWRKVLKMFPREDPLTPIP